MSSSLFKIFRSYNYGESMKGQKILNDWTLRHFPLMSEYWVCNLWPSVGVGPFTETPYFFYLTDFRRDFRTNKVLC